MSNNKEMQNTILDFEAFKKVVLNDFKILCTSREASLAGRKDVLSGKGKFGIFGDGKELVQIAMNKVFQNGDWRSGYYRDQTISLASGMATLPHFFAQLYAHADINFEPNSGGRQMNAHFATRILDEQGEFKDLTSIKISAADASPTANQIPRAIGLGLASKLYRKNEQLHQYNQFSKNGNEVIFATIGDASTSEGLFWESINAASVLKIPVAFVVYDDGYGISVPKKFQTAKESISKALSGFEDNGKDSGIRIYKIKGWDYAALCSTFESAIQLMRKEHKPALFHIEEITQPQGHSTSGSHERYKNEARMEFEKNMDCFVQFKKWIIENAIATEENLNEIHQICKDEVQEVKKQSWNAYLQPIKDEIQEYLQLLNEISKKSNFSEFIEKEITQIQTIRDPFRKDIFISANLVLRKTIHEKTNERENLKQWLNYKKYENEKRYNSYLHSQSKFAALSINEIKPKYSETSKQVNGFEVINNFFDLKLNEDARIIAFGEDVGNIGDVNQGFAGLQAKYGKRRVMDTGIREATIMGQAIGLALRGLRPIAEIQYLDYLLYGLQQLSDDLATLHYRTVGGQKAPAIIRTRGHRLEGIWHTGSPMQMILGSLRGMYVCVPRNLTQAAGMYNTLLQGDDPALVIECLNGYRLKELMPDNISEFNVPLGVPEILQEGNDITLVTYGSCVRVAQEAIKTCESFGISVELIDVQTLLPFDLNKIILNSLKKTNRIIFFDEDVPGGATAYLMQEVIEKQGGYKYLDASPTSISAKAHRSPYGTDGDYFSKPNAEDVFNCIYKMMSENEPGYFPEL
jgi:2-oxoisovalerate dehydrogenase E1 component